MSRLAVLVLLQKATVVPSLMEWRASSAQETASTESLCAIQPDCTRELDQCVVDSIRELKFGKHCMCLSGASGNGQLPHEYRDLTINWPANENPTKDPPGSRGTLTLPHPSHANLVSTPWKDPAWTVEAAMCMEHQEVCQT